jgi:hypothetical protein
MEILWRRGGKEERASFQHHLEKCPKENYKNFIAIPWGFGEGS